MVRGGKRSLEGFGGAEAVRLLKKHERLHVGAVIAKENGNERAARSCALKAFDILTDYWSDNNSERNRDRAKLMAVQMEKAQSVIGKAVYGARIARDAGIIDDLAIQTTGRRILSLLESGNPCDTNKHEQMARVAKAFGFHERQELGENAFLHALSQIHYKDTEPGIKNAEDIAKRFLDKGTAAGLAEKFIGREWNSIQFNPNWTYLYFPISAVADRFGVVNDAVMESRRFIIGNMLGIWMDLRSRPEYTDASAQLGDAVKQAGKWGMADYAASTARKMFDSSLERMDAAGSDQYIFIDRAYEAMNYARHFGFSEELKVLGERVLGDLSGSRIEVDVYSGRKKFCELALDLVILCGMPPSDERVMRVKKQISEEKVRKYMTDRLFTSRCPCVTTPHDEGDMPKTPQELGERFGLSKEDVLRIATEMIEANLALREEKPGRIPYWNLIILAKIARFCGLDGLMVRSAEAAFEDHLKDFGGRSLDTLDIAREFGLGKQTESIMNIQAVLLGEEKK